MDSKNRMRPVGSKPGAFGRQKRAAQNTLVKANGRPDAAFPRGLVVAPKLWESIA